MADTAGVAGRPKALAAPPDPEDRQVLLSTPTHIRSTPTHAPEHSHSRPEHAYSRPGPLSLMLHARNILTHDHMLHTATDAHNKSKFNIKNFDVKIAYV